MKFPNREELIEAAKTNFVAYPSHIHDNLRCYKQTIDEDSEYHDHEFAYSWFELDYLCNCMNKKNC